MYVCVSRWSLWGAERGWTDVGLWVAVCFLAKISSHRPTCKTTFARLTQSQTISQSFRVFISFRSRRDTTFFSFFETLFYTKLPFPLPVRERPRSRPGRASHTNRPKHRPWSRSGRVSRPTRPRSRPFAPETGLDLGRWSHHADLPVHFGWCGKSMRSACLDDGTTSFLGKFACTSPFEMCRLSV